jgi:hypothetical protein
VIPDGSPTKYGFSWTSERDSEKKIARMIFRPLIFTVRTFCILASIFLSSCASVSVKDVARLEPKTPSRLPAKVFVAPFSFNGSEIRVDRSGTALENFKFGLREFMTRSLVRRLPKYVAPAVPVAETAPLPRGNYWLIRGNFDRVLQGSRLLRSVVGLGVGATRLETTVLIYDLSGPHPKPFLRIVTTGGSNISPGIGGVATFFISGPTALTNLFNVLDGVRSGLTFDTIRTSREVNAALSEYLYQQGSIPYNQATGPKRLGEFPNRIGFPDRSKLKGSVTVEPAPSDSR